MGVIIGAGIYVLIGPATQRAGALVWASMLLASALCALTAFSYMELTSMFPKAGSEHEFARQVFPNWISFTTGWGMAVALVVAAAAVSLGFARYLQEFIGINQHVASILLLIAVGGLSLTGMQHARWLVIGLSMIQVGGLIGVIATGAHHIGDVSLTTGHGFSGILGGASNALVYLMFLVVNVVLITLRYQQPLTLRPFRVWWSIGWVPVVPCLGIIATLALSRELEMQPLHFFLLGFSFIS